LKRELQSIPVPKETILSLLLLLTYWLSYSYFQHEIFSRELSKIISLKSFILSSFVAIFSMRFCWENRTRLWAWRASISPPSVLVPMEVIFSLSFLFSL
jgi:hypothetical protein